MCALAIQAAIAAIALLFIGLASQGISPQFPGQGPQQKKRRSKRDESDDDAGLSDSDEEGGQVGCCDCHIIIPLCY
jgi:hypothetical protein